MHPEAHRVLGFVCCSEQPGPERFAFNLGQFQHLEGNTIAVNSNPVVAKAEQVNVLETLIGHELWDDAGNRLGKITDCLFSLKTGIITDYLFRADGWRGVTGALYRLPPHQILSFSRQRVRVAKAATHRWAAYTDGIEQKVSKVAQQVQSSLSSQAQSVTQQAKGNIQELTDKARQQAQAIAAQATQKAKTVGQSWSEELPQSQSILKEGRSILGQVQQRLSSLGEEVREEILPLTEQLREKWQPPMDKVQAKPPQPDTIDLSKIPPEDLEDEEPWI